jgi:peptide/nickel transport system permease protein
MAARFFLLKLSRALVTIWLVGTVAFVILRLSGDPLDALVGDNATQDLIEFYRGRLGLDRPLHEQYLGYLTSALSGNLGLTLQDERPALDVVLQAIPNTCLLGFSALLLSLLLGLPLGILAALYRNRPVDRFAMSFAVFGFSIPNVFLGLLLILLFSLWLRWLPSSGTGSFMHLIMPAITLGTASAGAMARFARASMLEVLIQPFMQAASAKGLSRVQLVVRHALPNAAIPILTIVGFRLGDLVAGSIVTEAVFAWPGVGRLLVDAVRTRDLAIVQAILIIVGATMTLANLLVDLAYHWIDPRIRVSAGSSGEPS